MYWEVRGTSVPRAEELKEKEHAGLVSTSECRVVSGRAVGRKLLCPKSADLAGSSGQIRGRKPDAAGRTNWYRRIKGTGDHRVFAPQPEPHSLDGRDSSSSLRRRLAAARRHSVFTPL